MKNTKKLPEELYAACDWIDFADEWEQAFENPDQYAKEAAANYMENRISGNTIDITVQDLKDVIAFEIERRAIS